MQIIPTTCPIGQWPQHYSKCSSAHWLNSNFSRWSLLLHDYEKWLVLIFWAAGCPSWHQPGRLLNGLHHEAPEGTNLFKLCWQATSALRTIVPQSRFAWLWLAASVCSYGGLQGAGNRDYCAVATQSVSKQNPCWPGWRPAGGRGQCVYACYRALESSTAQTDAHSGTDRRFWLLV